MLRTGANDVSRRGVDAARPCITGPKDNRQNIVGGVGNSDCYLHAFEKDAVGGFNFRRR